MVGGEEGYRGGIINHGRGGIHGKGERVGEETRRGGRGENPYKIWEVVPTYRGGGLWEHHRA